MPNYREYKLVCQHCGKTFLGSNPWTRYCSHRCSTQEVKDNLKLLRIAEDSAAVKEKSRAQLASQEYVSITQAARLLDTSRPTIYKILRDNGIEPLRCGPRTIRVRVADLVDKRNTYSPLHTPFPEIVKLQAGYVTITDAARILNLSKEQIYARIGKTSISSIRHKGQACYRLKELEEIILPLQTAEPLSWYTVEEITEKFGLSRQHVYDTVSKHKIPKKRDGHRILISQYDWDKTRKPEDFDPADFYTMQQILDRYGTNRDTVDSAARMRHITNFVRDKVRLYEKKGIDTYFNQRNTSKLCQPQK